MHCFYICCFISQHKKVIFNTRRSLNMCRFVGGGGFVSFLFSFTKKPFTLAKYNQNTHRFLTIEKGRKSEPIVLSLKQFSRAKNVVRVRAERIPANQKRLIYSLSMMVNLYSLYRTWCSPNRQLQSRAVFCSLEIKCSIESPWGQHWRSGNDHWR